MARSFVLGKRGIAILLYSLPEFPGVPVNLFSSDEVSILLLSLQSFSRDATILVLGGRGIFILISSLAAFPGATLALVGAG